MNYSGFMRRPAPRARPPAVANKILPAPTKGWVSAQNLANYGPLAAIRLENWTPTQTGVKLRGGSPRYATIDEDNTEPVRSLLSYTGSTHKLLAALETAVFDVTSVADVDTEPSPLIDGLSAGYWSYINFATTGGYYMPMVNGADDLHIYDGTYPIPVDDTAVVTLDYDAETGAFTAGETLTGGTSGDTATIIRVVDNGTTGTLWLNNATGTFQNNETITDSATGSATSDGTTTTVYGAITGSGLTGTSVFSHVSGHKNRLWFVESGTMNLWYLAVDSITGTATKFPLTGVFKKGGAAYFTATWSQDAGDGMDDFFVAVSTEGEVAVYQGTNPASASTWGLVGVYDISRPLGLDAVMKAGGELTIATEEGWVPLGVAVNKDRAALSLASISRPIEPDWSYEAQQRASLPWQIVKWASKNLAYITQPVDSDSDTAQCLVVNLETGAWAKYTGWDTRCAVLHQDQLYFGSNDGTIKRGEIGGYDDEDSQYVSVCIFAWDHFGSPGVYKTVKQARATFITATEFVPKLSASMDYSISLPAAPNAAVDSGSPGVWDVGLWDVAMWDAGLSKYTNPTRWRSIGKSGYAVAMQLQVTNGVSITPTAELVAMDVTWERGGLVV